jgi:hypothetical protein
MIIKTNRGDLPVKFGFNALSKFCDLTGVTYDEAFGRKKGLKPSHIATFIYVGFYYGAKAEGVECKVKDVEDVGDMIDENPEDLISQVMEAFAKQSPQGGGDSKKK